LVWRYPRVRTWQWLSSAGFTLGALGLELFGGDAADNGWNHGVLYDDAARRELRARSRAGRDRAATFSDISWPVIQWYPVFVDSLAVPLVTDDMNWGVVGQMELLNWQVMATVGFTTRLAQYAVGRSRPAVDECAKDPGYSKVCSPLYHGRTKSFLSGHTSLPFALAAADCAHHLALGLYGSRPADIGACVVLYAGAAATGTARIIADQHWATDVSAGALVGTSLGIAIPWGLHYAHGSAGLPDSVAVVPFGDRERLGLAAYGIF
jgi:membrane-associated phospholipid phosphatase